MNAWRMINKNAVIQYEQFVFFTCQLFLLNIMVKSMEISSKISLDGGDGLERSSNLFCQCVLPIIMHFDGVNPILLL